MLRLLAALGLAAGLVSAPIPPAPERWVTDKVGMLSPAVRAELDARLEGVERATGHQVIVWIGDTIGDEPLDDWAVRTFAAWKIGRKGIDDGLVIFVLATDRKIDIEVGYGLEGDVPDVIAGRIIRDVMVPKLAAGDADGAVRAGVEAVLARLGIAGVEPTKATPKDGQAIPWPRLVLWGLALLAFLVLLVTNPQMALTLLWAITSGGRGGGFGGGGGGFGGGGAAGGPAGGGFEDLFGRARQQRPARGADVEGTVDLTLEDVLRGTTRTVNLEGEGGAARKIEVKIPPGVAEGTRVRAAGEGAGASGARGDLYLRVRVLPHPRFERAGADLKTTVTVPLTTAVLGGETMVPTLDGPIGIRIPPGSRPGRAFRLRGHGLPRLEGGGRGDLLAALGVDLPEELDPRERELFEELKRLGH